MPATNLTQAMTRQQLATSDGICTKTLSRFLSKNQRKIESLCLINLREVQWIIQKYPGTD
jgi:hypothetical protein